MEQTFKYEIGDRVMCISLSPDNTERLIRGMMYEVKGATKIDGVEIFSLMGSNGDIRYSPDRFHKIARKKAPDSVTTIRKVQNEDVVNHPKHYQFGKFETIEVIAEVTKNLSGLEAVCVANALKYIMRFKNKNGAEDIKKAIWYLRKMVGDVEGDSVKMDCPATRPMTNLQRGYIAGLTVKLGLDRYDLPVYLTPVSDYTKLTEAEASMVIDKLLAITNYVKFEK